MILRRLAGERRMTATLSIKTIVERIVVDECRTRDRGLAFLVDEAELIGRPAERLRVWGTLHFLPGGSPFCCAEPGCHLGLFGDRLDRIRETLCRELELRQAVRIEFVKVATNVHAGVEFQRL